MASKRATVSTLCSLPDDVICHILSFLSTEESVRTRVLSTRWKNLFSLVPVLDFDCDYPSTNSIPDPNSPLDPTSIRSILNSLIPISTYTSSVPAHRVKRFLDFVEWVFNSYKPNTMNKFSFKSKRRFKGTSRLLSWISKSVLLGVCELDISMFFKVPKKFPRVVFNCETLTDLKLSGNFILDVPNEASLPRVKNIWILHSYFSDSYSAWRLFRSCPVLESLFINLTYTGVIQVLDVSIPSLKSLMVLQSNSDNYVLVLNTPNLEFLDYMGCVPHGVYANHQGLKSLTKACFALPSHIHDRYDPLEKLFSVICHVPVLRICTWTLEALKRSGRSPPIFHNLTRLEIRVVEITSFDTGFLLHLLFAMPNLEVLVIDNNVIDDEPGQLFPKDVPTCVSLRLKEVRFIGFFMMEYELQLVKYFLKNAEFLDTLKIECNLSVELQYEISLDLLSLRRYSRTCQIVLT